MCTVCLCHCVWTCECLCVPVRVPECPCVSACILSRVFMCLSLTSPVCMLMCVLCESMCCPCTSASRGCCGWETLVLEGTKDREVGRQGGL